ncbi:uncharacterized protein A4U43_C07F13450 [Asparagus officinalis]|uniref:C3H1-type domain-containing protein n=1 Tax=Asparagus officinalis TaxID=4686 RepID=A0A5P1EF10_ASPOF|nr:zinc finger CCCH domain-containing protein 15 [Asparagus officinalis]ONK63291.1 uncharacterized protein A4U43_C07F13450 [Asparagus officinalis]
MAIRELQQMVNRYNDCYLQLKDAVTAVEMLREENLQLAAKNLELDFLLEDMERAEVIGVSPAARSVRKGSDLDSSGGSGSGSGSGLSSISGSGPGSGSHGARGLPKSISIRSRGFLAINQPDPGGAHRVRLPVSPALAQDGDKEKAEVELDAYSQGNAKTELCNKWGEMGCCPYSDRCQFAHGIEELRPVIRHPRYKTQLCRMMGSGGDCPYGHRCHFRHAQQPTAPK